MFVGGGLSRALRSVVGVQGWRAFRGGDGPSYGSGAQSAPVRLQRRRHEAQG